MDMCEKEEKFKDIVPFRSNEGSLERVPSFLRDGARHANVLDQQIGILIRA